MNLYIYEQTTSTNDLAKGVTFRHGDTLWAYHQSAGRGQRGNKWIGGVGENITFSVVLEPTFLDASDQFYISQITALALLDAMAQWGIEAKIKWTNDIYVGDYKLAGILIENSLNDGFVARSIVGIGLNVNQLLFDSALPNPTSMRLQRGCRFPLEEVLRSVQRKLMEWCEVLKNGERDRVINSYHMRLYRRGEQHTYRLASGELIEGVIEGVETHGELILRHVDGQSKGYLFREIEFLIEARNR